MRLPILVSPLIFALSALVGCSDSAKPSVGVDGALGPASGPNAEAGVPNLALPSGPPVDVGAPNVPEFKPAFPEQTRAPQIKTAAALQVVEVATGLNKPWAIAFLPDQRMLVTEKPTGNLFIIGKDGSKSPPIGGVPPVDGRDQGGLLDVEVAPDHADSKLVYWTYYEARPGGNGLAVARGKLTDDAAPSLSEVQVIFRMEPTLDSTKHAGGRLVFAPDGLLFVTLGERSIVEGRVQARELDSHLGKVVRIKPDGTVPQDNPFVGRAGARPEIWTIGHRNVLAATLDSRARLWVVEMGPKGGDELNLVQRGKDYGWPLIGYGEEYSGAPIHQNTQAAELEQPVYYWDPVISPSGLTIYSGALFPEWKGDFFVGGLSSTALIRLMVRNDKVVGEERLLTDLRARIREVVQGSDGALYLLTDDVNGKLLKVTPKP